MVRSLQVSVHDSMGLGQQRQVLHQRGQRLVALYDMEESCRTTATVGNGGTRLSKTQDMGCMGCRHLEGKKERASRQPYSSFRMHRLALRRVQVSVVES